MDDLELLREYAVRKSEEAFETLVSRYADLVYSAARRQVHNPALAEEVTQAVFILLAQKAGRIRHGSVLAGWLYSATWFTARRALRNEQLRERRESEAAMDALNSVPNTEADWDDIAPLLDDAMMGLSEKDRNALLLRFFKQKQLKEVGLDLGITEEAARKRIARALEVLRKALAKRDVAIPSALLVGLLSTKSVSASSAGTAALASAALKTPLLATTTLALVKGTIKTMAWTKIKTTLVGGAALLLVAGTVTVTLTQRRDLDRTRKLYLDEIRRAETALNNSDSATANRPITAVTNVVDWHAVDSPDYRKYIANMKAIGVPWETIKDIIIADVSKLYLQKAQALVGSPKKQKFWETDRSVARPTDKNRVDQLDRIDAERRAVLRELIGFESNEEVRRGGWALYAPSGPQLSDFLTPEKVDQVHALEKYDLLRSDLFKQKNAGWTKQDLDETIHLQEAKRAALARVLTPQELEQYDLVLHPTATSMRAELGAFKPTEDEFRKIFSVRRDLDEAIGTLHFQAEVDPTIQQVGLKMAEQSKEADQKLEQALGPQRYADYRRSLDPQFQILERVAQGTPLPEEALIRAYQVNKASEEQLELLGNHPPQTEQELAAFKNDLMRIERTQEEQLRQILGNDAFDQFKKSNPSTRTPPEAPPN